MDDSVIRNIRPGDVDRPSVGRRARCDLVKNRGLVGNCLSAIWISELVRVVVGIPVPVKRPHRIAVGSNGIHAQEAGDQRIVVALVHVYQVGGLVHHVPGVVDPVIVGPIDHPPVRLLLGRLQHRANLVRRRDNAGLALVFAR